MNFDCSLKEHCNECTMFDPEYKNIYGGGVIQLVIAKCANSSICENAINQYRKLQETKNSKK